jgi:hypothetical protein
MAGTPLHKLVKICQHRIWAHELLLPSVSIAFSCDPILGYTSARRLDAAP